MGSRPLLYSQSSCMLVFQQAFGWTDKQFGPLEGCIVILRRCSKFHLVGDHFGHNCSTLLHSTPPDCLLIVGVLRIEAAKVNNECNFSFEPTSFPGTRTLAATIWYMEYAKEQVAAGECYCARVLVVGFAWTGWPLREQDSGLIGSLRPDWAAARLLWCSYILLSNRHYSLSFPQRPLSLPVLGWERDWGYWE